MTATSPGSGWRRLGWAATALALLLAGLSLALTWRSVMVAPEEPGRQDLLRSQLELLALELSLEFEAARLQAEGLVRYGGVLGQTGTAGYFSEMRQNLQALLRQTLTDLPALAAVYAVWEPDGLDAQDEVFLRDYEYGSNERGRFASFWHRDAQGALVNHVISEEELREWSWRCTRAVCVRTVVGPQGERLVTVAVGSRRNGGAVGTYGVALPMTLLRERVAAYHRELSSGAGHLSLVDSEGLPVASAGVLPVGESLRLSLPVTLAGDAAWLMLFHAPEQQPPAVRLPPQAMVPALLALPLAWFGGVLLGRGAGIRRRAANGE